MVPVSWASGVFPDSDRPQGREKRGLNLRPHTRHRHPVFGENAGCRGGKCPRGADSQFRPRVRAAYCVVFVRRSPARQRPAWGGPWRERLCMRVPPAVFNASAEKCRPEDISTGGRQVDHHPDCPTTHNHFLVTDRVHTHTGGAGLSRQGQKRAVPTLLATKEKSTWHPPETAGKRGFRP